MGKPRFVKEGKEILFVDRNGAKWSLECVDGAFMLAQRLKKAMHLANYYSSERVDDKDFYNE